MRAFLLKSREEIINRIHIFAMIFLSSSYIVCNELVGIQVQMVLWGVLALSLLREGNNNNVISGNGYLISLLLVVVLSDVMNSERFTLTILMCVMLFISYLYIKKTSLTGFISAYTDVMSIISVISLLGFFACLTIPAFQNYNLLYMGRKIIANYYIFVYNVLGMRNYGMFWEPGAFQCFLSVALIFEYYRTDSSKYRFFLFIIASITTFSTTGYLSIGIILFLILLKNRSSNGHSSIRKFAVLITPVLILAIFTYQGFLFSGKGSAFGKLTSFVEDKEYVGGGEISSASVRYFSVIKPFEEFIESPLIGCGYENLQKKTFKYTQDMNTCTFINYFAIYGVFAGVLFLVGFYRFGIPFERGVFLKMLLFVLFFTITMSENVVRIPIFIIIAFYGLIHCKDRL